MATPGLAHLLLFIGGLHKFIPGLIHSFKEDAGAQSIAGFTNYETAKAEILWAFRIIGKARTVCKDFFPFSCYIEINLNISIPGVEGIASGFAQFFLLSLSVASKDPSFYTSVLRFYAAYDILHSLLMILVMKFTGNGTETVAPEAPGNWTPLFRFVLMTISLILLCCQTQAQQYHSGSIRSLSVRPSANQD